MISLEKQQLLIHRARQGDQDAYERLYSSYCDHIYLTAFSLTGNHHSAQDLVQEVFCAGFRYVREGKFSGGRFGCFLKMAGEYKSINIL